MRTEIKPFKYFRAGIKLLALTSGHSDHGRYIAVTPRTGIIFRWVMTVTYSRYKFVTVSLLKRLRNGRLASETAVPHMAVSEAKCHLDPEVV
jgi:hypothetical protein